MEYIQIFFQYLLHLDHYLTQFVAHYGVWTYAILFLIIFCETGLVVTPFLPGDSLLFAAGSIAANSHDALQIEILLPLLIAASILGNKVNYLIGKAIGPRVFAAQSSWLLNRKHLLEAHQFYEKHGGKTIIMARFIPIIRTFAPFVAGVGYMSLSQFTLFNIVSACLWIGTLVTAGYCFGALPIIKENFNLVIYIIIIVSLLPPIGAYFCRKFTDPTRSSVNK